MGLALVVVLLLLGLAPSAGAEAPGVLDAIDAEEVALAGPDVLVARELDGGVQLDAVPRAGGPARTLAAIPSAQLAWRSSLAGSSERVVVAVQRNGRKGSLVGWQIHSGPPTGPLQIVWRTRERGPRDWWPLHLELDGDRALVVEVQRDGPGARALLLGPAGERQRLWWSRRRFIPVAIAGEHAAVIAGRPRRVATVRLRDGRVGAVRRVREPRLTEVDVAADGRVVVTTAEGLVALRAGAPPRRLPGTVGLGLPRFAGETIAAVRYDQEADVQQPVLVAPDEMPRIVGAPTAEVDDIAADAEGVAWLANGCVRYAPVTGASPAAPAGDPCPSTEVGLAFIATSRLRDGAVRVPVHCIATPTDACRGTLVLSSFETKEVVARGPFAVAAGTTARAPVPVNARALAVAREEGGWIVDAEIPGGRARPGSGASELSLAE